jgi:hypothetical protein
VKGYAIQPLYRTAPAAALNDPIFYELLAISDALRQSKARERNQAAQKLRKRLFQMQNPNLNLLLETAHRLRPLLDEVVRAAAGDSQHRSGRVIRS